MTYTLLGNKDFVLKELDSILKDYNKEEISTYDLEDNSIKEVLDDLNTLLDKESVELKISLEG